MTRIPHHTNQFAHRQQYGRWNWRRNQSQHTWIPKPVQDTIYILLSFHHLIIITRSFSLSGRPSIRETSDRRNDQHYTRAFDNGPRNFEPCQVTWTTPEMAPPSPNYHTTPT
ncbi:hypothetical protein TNCV_2690801 [Trichonephila clavipes]|uniref:Uncharacterized protein n=1 Tax=Trichonephila clavipes TaxID=2585209 RepID=A0A8X7BBN6_TRICX|nr:hypothetical protein TNCV_2690801 [Trichonephila clavipes]